MLPIDLIPAPYRWLAGGAALLVALAGAALWLHARDQANFMRGANEANAATAKRDVEQARQMVLKAAENAAETDRRQAEQAKAQEKHDAQIAQANADRAASDAVAGRMRTQLANFVAAARLRAVACDSAPVANGPAASEDGIGLLADLFSRANTRAGTLSSDLDIARAAGKQCEAEYDALKPAQH